MKSRKGKIYLQEYSKIQNALHGKYMKIIINKDRNFYYQGNVSVQAYKTENYIKTINITCDVEPYKYERFSSDDDWLWDPFDFYDGIINETKDLEIDGERDVIIVGRRQKVVPKFICSNSMDVIFNNETYTLPKRNKLCFRY